VGRVGGVRFVNDSKATNVDAVKRALECFDTPVVLIMGGQNKKGDFTQLKSQVRQHVKTLVAMGEARDEIVTALAGDPEKGILEATSLEEAVEKAFGAAGDGETVLLSPACASFDMFDNYAQRGDSVPQNRGKVGMSTAVKRNGVNRWSMIWDCCFPFCCSWAWASSWSTAPVRPWPSRSLAAITSF
jgi:hypothetical protein